MSNAKDLVNKGIELYGRNKIEPAVKCWLEALVLEPANQEVREFLNVAGIDPANIEHHHPKKRPGNLPKPNPETEKEQVREIAWAYLVEGTGQDALDSMTLMREKYPEDPLIQRELSSLETFIETFSRTLGSSDQPYYWCNSKTRLKHGTHRKQKQELIELLISGAKLGQILNSIHDRRFEMLSFLAKSHQTGLIDTKPRDTVPDLAPEIDGLQCKEIQAICHTVAQDLDGTKAVAVVNLETGLLDGYHLPAAEFEANRLEAAVNSAQELITGKTLTGFTNPNGKPPAGVREIFIHAGGLFHFLGLDHESRNMVLIMTTESANQGFGWLALRTCLKSLADLR